MTANGGIAFATNRTTDSGVIVSNVRRDTITDLSTFVQSRRAAQENRLTDAMKTDIAELSIAGRRAFRTAVTGSFRNTRLTYLLTVIEGTEEIAIVNAWTTTSNYDQQRVALEALSGNVAGL